jgi:hypothetical protein
MRSVSLSAQGGKKYTKYSWAYKNKTARQQGTQEMQRVELWHAHPLLWVARQAPAAGAAEASAAGAAEASAMAYVSICGRMPFLRRQQWHTSAYTSAMA